MKIKLLQGISGVRVSFSPGAVVDWDDEEAKRLIDAGYAVIVRSEAVETAAMDMGRSEKAVRRGKA